MGVDVSAIIGHNLSMEEVLRFPQIIASWENVNALAYSFHAEMEAFPQADDDAPTANWDASIQSLDEKTVLSVWDYWSTSDDDPNVPSPLTIDIDTSFGWLKVNRQTICICPFEHKFANLEVPKTSSYILRIMRMIAQHLEAKEVVYAPDSAFPESYLEELSFMGRSIEEIIAFGTAKFGASENLPTTSSDSKFYVDRF